MNKKRYLSLASIVVLCLSLLLISGCGGSGGNKEGDSGTIPTVSEAACITCHSTTLEALTGVPIVAAYNASVHNLNSVGCQDCHGAGGSHNGIGPIPFPKPNNSQCAPCHDSGTATSYALVTEYSTSKHLLAATEDGRVVCNRCHTHQGAVLSAISHFTGDGTVMVDTNPNAPGTVTDPEPIRCNTCHDTHNPKTIGETDLNLRVDTKWNPSTTVGTATVLATNSDGTVTDKTGNAQFRLCTQCHSYTNHAGTLLASGTAAESTTGKPATGKTGHHETSWYRVISTTHYDNPATGFNSSGGALTPGNVIEGYNLRTNTAHPCFDCHGHEAQTNTNQVADLSVIEKPNTIYTDWAQSVHAGGLLKAKIAAANAWPNHRIRNNVQGTYAVDSAMVSGVSTADLGPTAITSTLKKATTAGAWAHYPWNNTSSRGACQKCHTATGFTNYITSQTTYVADGSGNDFSYLSGWSATTGSPQAEVLYCWACHSNAGAGVLRNSGQVAITTSEYTYGGAAVVFPNSHKSNACIACHSGRGNVDTMTTAARSSRFIGHDAPAAGFLFSAVTHMGYEFAGQNYANSSHFEHDKIDLTGSGPCASCHMGGKNHKFSVLSDDGLSIRSQALCDTCHTSHGLMTVTTIEEEKAGYVDALKLTVAYVKNTIVGGNYQHAPIASSTLTMNDYGALQNSVITDAGAFAHNSKYIKRLLFDSIDWLDNGVLDGTITINAALYPDTATWFSANAITGVATRP